MTRRSLLLLSSAIGAVLPWGRSAAGQDPSRRPTRPSRAGDDPPRTARRAIRDDVENSDEPEAPAAEREDLPPNLPQTEPGHSFKSFDISRYTGLPHKENNPQNSIVDWIFRATTSAPWHGEKIAILSAGRLRLRVYHNAKMIDKVAQVVERFVDTEGKDRLTLTVRFATASDTRWRYEVYRRLNLIGSGPQGQQLWTMGPEDAALVLNQMQLWQGFRIFANQRFDIFNGGTLTLASTKTRTFTGGLQRGGSGTPGFQPKTEELEEGVNLRISPLLTYDGDTLDAAIELTSNNFRDFHATRVVAPRDAGPGDLRVDVPEVSETRLNQTIKDWPLGQTLLISGGIQPALLGEKGGLFNMKIPGTVATSTELLVFIDVALADSGGDRRSDRLDRSDRSASRR